MKTDKGNILWDCISLVDRATVEIVKGLGGLAGIAISHPHYYSSMVEWAHAFDAPIHLHAADSQWIMRPDPSIKLWDGDTLSLATGVTLIRCGGHFAGGTVLHWAQGGHGKGALLSGDIVQVIPDRKFVDLHAQLSESSFRCRRRRSSASAACSNLTPTTCIYGAWFDREIPQGRQGRGRPLDRALCRRGARRRLGRSALTKQTIRRTRMARIDDVPVEDLTPRQKKIYDDIARTRPPRPNGALGGPFSVWIRTPDIAEHADRLTNCFRVAPKLDRRLIEMIVLMVCRDATAKYAWSVHEPLALKEGLAQDDGDAIRARRKPDFKRDDERHDLRIRHRAPRHQARRARRPTTAPSPRSASMA